MLTYDQLFLETVADLRQKISIGGEYNLIRACGLCRHLLLDNHPLLHLTNRSQNVPIFFRINDLSKITIIGSDGKIKKAITGWINPEPISMSTVDIGLKEFLQVSFLKYHQHEFTVKDILGAASHYMGGVHSGKPQIKESVFVALDKAMRFAENITLVSIAAICKIILSAMEPLEKHIISHPPVGRTFTAVFGCLTEGNLIMSRRRNTSEGAEIDSSLEIHDSNRFFFNFSASSKER